MSLIDEAAEVLAKMPPLSHWPNRPEPFDPTQCEVTRWVLGQPAVLRYFFDHLRQQRYIVFDKATGTWSGNPDAKADHEEAVRAARSSGRRGARAAKRTRELAAISGEPKRSRGRSQLWSDDDMLAQLSALKVPATFSAWASACQLGLGMSRSTFSLRVVRLADAKRITKHPLGHYMPVAPGVPVAAEESDVVLL